ncbi:MAG: magnesium transporter [Ruminiclostridium sp.]|nr:magnesium transporter [Ruminiclostridium sp.]
MNTVTTFYLSRVIGKPFYSSASGAAGKIIDFVADVNQIRPRITAVRVKTGNSFKLLDFSNFVIEKNRGQYLLKCPEMIEISELPENTLMFAKNVMDRQLVDMDGRKVVRVNDVRLAVLTSGVFAVAVDVGIEGLLRRLGVAKPLKNILRQFGLGIPSKLILWDEVAAIDFSHTGIKLAKEYSKLLTLHTSDLADIIEDLDRNTQIAIFSTLDEEKAADVLEELETDAQINILESMTTEKAADVLEKMPADEVADLLDEMQEDKAEELLNEMESDTSEEIRELMEYPDNSVGSIMTTEYISFNENTTVGEALDELRTLRPESDSIYYLYVLDDDGKLLATVSLRDIVISQLDVKLQNIMNTKVIFVYDTDRIDSLAEMISKYNLLAIPVASEAGEMLGMVVIDDVVSNLLRSRKRRF